MKVFKVNQAPNSSIEKCLASIKEELNIINKKLCMLEKIERGYDMDDYYDDIDEPNNNAKYKDSEIELNSEHEIDEFVEYIRDLYKMRNGNFVNFYLNGYGKHFSLTVSRDERIRLFVDGCTISSVIPNASLDNLKDLILNSQKYIDLEHNEYNVYQINILQKTWDAYKKLNLDRDSDKWSREDKEKARKFYDEHFSDFDTEYNDDPGYYEYSTARCYCGRPENMRSTMLNTAYNLGITLD